MDDNKADLPYPFNQDLSTVLRCKLPNSRETAALIQGAIQLAERILGQDPAGSVLRFITLQAVIAEANENVHFGCMTTEAAHRYRWECQREFYADLFRFAQWQSHFPGAHTDEIAEATEEIIHGSSPVRAIHQLCDWDIRRRLETPTLQLGLLAIAEAEGDPPIQAAIAEHHRENEEHWRLYCEAFLKARHLKLRPGVTLGMCVTLLTALADGLTARAITDASSVFDGQRGCSVLSTGALALIASCAEPDGRADGLSLEDSAAAIMGGRT